MSDGIEGQRREAIRQLEAEERQLGKAQAQLDAKRAAVQEQKARLALPLPDPTFCEFCWFTNGTRSILRSVSSPDLRGRDLWKCTGCGYEEVREA